MLDAMSAPHEPEATARHALATLAAQSVEDGLRTLGSAEHGLTAEEAAERLVRCGPNEVATASATSVWRQLLVRVANPLNLLLLVLALVSVFTGNVQSAVIIALMVLLSITLGWVQEHRSGRAAQALRAMVHTTATVLRRGGATVASAAERGGHTGTDTLELPIAQLVPATSCTCRRAIWYRPMCGCCRRGTSSSTSRP